MPLTIAITEVTVRWFCYDGVHVDPSFACMGLGGKDGDYCQRFAGKKVEVSVVRNDKSEPYFEELKEEEGVASAVGEVEFQAGLEDVWGEPVQVCLRLPAEAFDGFRAFVMETVANGAGFVLMKLYLIGSTIEGLPLRGETSYRDLDDLDLSAKLTIPIGNFISKAVKRL